MATPEWVSLLTARLAEEFSDRPIETVRGVVEDSARLISESGEDLPHSTEALARRRLLAAGGGPQRPAS